MITNNTVDDIGATWSSDREWIAFATRRDGGNYEIYVMTRDGQSVTRVTNNSFRDREPSWFH